jgi:hypothetical protein
MNPTQTVIRLMKKMNYTWTERPYELNIVGIRSDSTTPNKFDDSIHVFCKTADGEWDHRIHNATTDPGTFWLNNPMSPQGTAILREGQYKNTYSLGMHRGKYLALVQTGSKVTVVRDYDRDTQLDYDNHKTETGFFGINIHRALVSGVTKSVDKHSAGCQVFENATEFAAFIARCTEHRKRYGNRFSYTLIDLRNTARRFKRKIEKMQKGTPGKSKRKLLLVLGLGALIATGTSVWLWRKRKSKSAKSKRS